MLIHNINGTSQLTCSCGSWLQHWKNFSGQIVRFCPVDNCLNTDLCGAHVQRLGDPRWYIYPLCNAHNQSDSVLSVSDAYKLVSANKSETCERRW
jgi:hypothetical protein